MTGKGVVAHGKLTEETSNASFSTASDKQAIGILKSESESSHGSSLFSQNYLGDRHQKGVYEESSILKQLSLNSQISSKPPSQV